MKENNRRLPAALGVLVLVLLLGSLLMGGLTGSVVMGPGMMGWGAPRQAA